MRVLLTFGLLGVSLCAFGSDVPHPEPKPKPEPEPVGPDWVPTSYCGKVVGLTAQGVVIKPQGALKILEITPLPNGTTRERVYVQDYTRPPREFVFSDALFPDRPGSKRSMLFEHWPADVRVGDFVFISCNRLRGTDYCTRIEIRRRPGGKVPLAIGDDKLPIKERIATQLNAIQAREEEITRGLPRLFLHFHP
jgi:hypothetical protein